MMSAMPDTDLTPAEQTAENTAQIAVNTENAVPSPSQELDESDRQALGEREEVALSSHAKRQGRADLAAGQRRVNLIWEGSQAAMALIVVITTASAIFIGRTVQHNAVPFPAEWWTIVGLVIGFYFGRTNHARIGDDGGAEQGSGKA